MTQPVERFSSRVEDYVKYRPGYPTEILHLLKTECGLTPQSVIADIGSGTGKLTEIFLDNGNEVIGVEPNHGMRAAAEDLLRNHSSFRSVAGSAEETTLADRCVDFVTAAQAFHWFNAELAKLEASRILKPNGWAVLVWNDRKLVATRFLEDYEALLLQFGTDYKEVRHDKAEGRIAEFFAPSSPSLTIFPNYQLFDLSGLRGRVRSSSYTPEPGHPNFETMMLELEKIFEKHQQNGRVTFDYDTKVYYGHLPATR